MGTLEGIAVALLTVVGMEAFAFAVHRWVMHGPMWFLHKSHHEPREGIFEANDWFAVIFATPSIALIYMGAHLRMHPVYLWLGIGIAMYGAIYFFIHDVVVHRRIPHRYVPRSTYFKRVVQAHRMHHAVESKEGCVSFGFVYAPPIRELKAQLATHADARLRRPAKAMAGEPSS